MGYRAYLNLVTDETTSELFEANNALPLFWIGLLDANMMAKIKKPWFKYRPIDYGQEDYRTYPSTYLIVNQSDFINNTEIMANYLHIHYPDIYPVFIDFKNYLREKLKANNSHLEIDSFPLAYLDSSNKYWDKLNAEIENIKTSKPLSQLLCRTTYINECTGFDSLDFGGNSVAYQNKIAQEEQIKPTTQKQVQDSATSNEFRIINVIKSLIMLLLCPVFSFGIYLMYRDDGLSSLVTFMLICNAICYILYSYEVKNELKKPKRKNKTQ